jgi:hypothetical protein
MSAAEPTAQLVRPRRSPVTGNQSKGAKGRFDRRATKADRKGAPVKGHHRAGAMNIESNLRLFDVSMSDNDMSHAATTRRAEHERTVSQHETELVVSRIETKSVETSVTEIDEPNLLAVMQAARNASRAGAALDEAIETARRDGHSWRVIARAAGIPFQTLHRRGRHGFGQPDKRG